VRAGRKDCQVFRAQQVRRGQQDPEVRMVPQAETEKRVPEEATAHPDAMEKILLCSGLKDLAGKKAMPDQQGTTEPQAETGQQEKMGHRAATEKTLQDTNDNQNSHCELRAGLGCSGNSHHYARKNLAARISEFLCVR
jgi:hypothetical protein